MSDHVDFEPIWERLRDRALARKEAANKEPPGREAPPPEPKRCYGVTVHGMPCGFYGKVTHNGQMWCRHHNPARKRR